MIINRGVNMKTLDFVLANYNFESFDLRDKIRLMAFCDAETIEKNGCELINPSEHVPLKWTEEVILEQLKIDLVFAFDNALDKRRISSAAMFHVISMWNYILDAEDIPKSYAQYGLPYFKATAVHFGFPNPIGDDVGNEYKYSAEYDGGMDEIDEKSILEYEVVDSEFSVLGSVPMYHMYLNGRDCDPVKLLEKEAIKRFPKDRFNWKLINE